MINISKEHTIHRSLGSVPIPVGFVLRPLLLAPAVTLCMGSQLHTDKHALLFCTSLYSALSCTVICPFLVWISQVSSDEFANGCRYNPWTNLSGWHIEVVSGDWLHVVDLTLVPEAAASVFRQHLVS